MAMLATKFHKSSVHQKVGLDTPVSHAACQWLAAGMNFTKSLGIVPGFSKS